MALELEPGSRRRVAFYPCCALDIEEPLKLMRAYVDEVVFCDVDDSLPAHWTRFASRVAAELPRARFLNCELRAALDEIAPVDVLFYRRDSAGEGGSGVFVLGDQWLPLIVRRFPPAGGLIVSDGSNSRGGNFKRMTRASGLVKWGWHFFPSAEQLLLESHVLWVVSVTPEATGRRSC